MPACQSYTAIGMLVTEKIIKDISSAYIIDNSLKEVIFAVENMSWIGK
jgi:hypothetical protein